MGHKVNLQFSFVGVGVMLKAFWFFFFKSKYFFIQECIQDLERSYLDFFTLRTKQALRDLTLVTIVVLCLSQLLSERGLLGEFTGEF